MLLEVPITSAPAARNASVTLVPKPPLAPVMSTTGLASSFMASSLLPRRPCHPELGIECKSAAGIKGLAGYVRGVVRRQESEHGSDLFGTCRATHGDVALHFRFGLGIIDPGAVDRRHHCTRS